MKNIRKSVYIGIAIYLIGGNYIYANTEDHRCNIEFEQNLDKDFYKNINDMFIIEEKIESENSEFFKSDIKYPYLKVKDEYNNKKDKNNDVIKIINNEILNTIKDFKSNVKKGSKEYKEMYDKYSNKEKNIKYQYEAVSKYEITYNKNNILSIPITMYEFTGGAHGLTNIKTFNYDLKTGKQLNLEDLFKLNSNYKDIINTHIEKKIKENPTIYFGVANNEFKGIRDNQEYYMSEEGIVIYFSLYEIAPYSTGIPMFTITWDEIINYLENPDIIK